jgi:hypothetical protein
MNSTPKALCLPAKVYPIGMAALILFDLYRGSGSATLKHFFALIFGTGLLYILCISGMESLAWILLALPLFLVLAIVALIILDLSLINVTHTFQEPCAEGSHRMSKSQTCST